MVFHRQSAGGDVWGSTCTNPGCYGVPLYRQYLTKVEMDRWTDDKYKCSDQAKPPRTPKANCRWPFIRMAGEDLSQRETLTINNGTYYVDTTVSLDTQNTENYTTTAPRFLNVFKAGETYYMFFAYVKPSTVQTYQIYVGPGFDTSTHFKFGRVNVDELGGDFFFQRSPTVQEIWADPQLNGDILTVNIDFSGMTALDPSPDSGLCQPRTFCKPAGSKDEKKMCVSALKPDDPIIAANKNFVAQNDAVCQTWATKDLDCPPIVRDKDRNWMIDGGPGFCLHIPHSCRRTGFAVADDKLPSAWPRSAFLKDAKPTQGAPDWATRFKRPAKEPDQSAGRLLLPGSPAGDRNCHHALTSIQRCVAHKPDRGRPLGPPTLARNRAFGYSQRP